MGLQGFLSGVLEVGCGMIGESKTEICDHWCRLRGICKKSEGFNAFM